MENPTRVGTEELTRVVDAVLDAVDLGKAVLADGKVNLADVPAILSGLPQLGIDLVGVIGGAKTLPGELKDLSSEEVAALGAHVVSRLGVADAHAVEIVEAALAVAAASLNLVRVLAKAPAS